MQETPICGPELKPKFTVLVQDLDITWM